MIVVAHCLIPEFVSEETLAAWLAELPDNRRESLIRSLGHGRARGTLFGLQLLKWVARKLRVSDFEIRRIDFTEGRKPAIDGGPDFNISHSGGAVICAVSATRRVGIDVERRRLVRHEQLARRIASPDDERTVSSQDEFFDAWTRKESVVKAVGLSVAFLGRVALRNRGAHLGADRWHLHPIDIGNSYVACLAYDQEAEEVVIHRVTPAQLTGSK